jgi:anti-sigma factor RsiW
MKSRHIPFTKLAEMAESGLAAAEGAALFEHVSACSRCAAKMEELKQLVHLMRTDRAEDAPRDVLANAVGLFRARASSVKPSVVRRILAALSFDSAQSLPAYGLRSGQPQSRQFLYSAGENDLDLRLTPSGETWIVSGQVLGKCTGGEVKLEGESATAAVPMNELCEFTLPPVPTGRYTLQLLLNHVEVEVPDLDLKA